ncbi:MAG: DUF2141 domain-containing protein [Silvanigrellaceae bacterium]
MQAFESKLCPLFSAFVLLLTTQTGCGEKSGETVGKDPRVPITVNPIQVPGPTNPQQTPSVSADNQKPSNDLSGAGGSSQPTGAGSGNTNGDNSGNGNSPLNPPRAVLTVSIRDLHSVSGNFCMSIFASSEGFPDSAEKAIVAECFAVAEKSFDVQIQNLPPGTYAIAGWHDENKDKKLNYNLFGIPKEGLAFSENGKPRLTPPPGPPSFESISFVLGNEDKSTQMKTSYLLDLL